MRTQLGGLVEIRQLHKETITDVEADELARLLTLVDPRRLRSDPAVTRDLAVDGLLRSVPTYAFSYFGLFDDDRLIGMGQSDGAVNSENADVSEVGIFIDPDHEGQGNHRLLFDHIDAFERANGRTRYWGWGDASYEPSRAFWEDELGYTLAYDERISRCDIAAVDPAMMNEWRERASERAGGYTLVRAEMPLADELIGHYAAGLEGMNDAPLDALDHQRETFSEARAREIQSLYLQRNDEIRLIFAIEQATDVLAGYTMTRVPRLNPALSKQGDTVTVAAHRGKGIGRWLKADMWFWLREERPDALYLDTGNAESNRPMLDINEAMGFRDVMHHNVWHLPPPSTP